MDGKQLGLAIPKPQELSDVFVKQADIVSAPPGHSDPVSRTLCPPNMRQHEYNMSSLDGLEILLKKDRVQPEQFRTYVAEPRGPGRSPEMAAEIQRLIKNGDWKREENYEFTQVDRVRSNGADERNAVLDPADFDRDAIRSHLVEFFADVDAG